MSFSSFVSFYHVVSFTLLYIYKVFSFKDRRSDIQKLNCILTLSPQTSSFHAIEL